MWAQSSKSAPKISPPPSIVASHGSKDIQLIPDIPARSIDLY